MDSWVPFQNCLQHQAISLSNLSYRLTSYLDAPNWGLMEARVVHFWGCPPLSPFRGMPPAKILRGCRFPKWLPKWLFDSKEGGIERERGRPDINFAHARGKLVGTESRRMKLEPDRDRRRRRRRRRPRNEMQIWRLLGRGGRKKEKVRGKRSGGGTREA